MKTALFCAFLVPLISLADYVPGRTRPTAIAEMEAINGDGKYAEVKTVRLVELTTDEVGISHYELNVDGQVYSFAVKKSSPSSCGDLYEAQEGETARLILRDMSFAQCEFRSKHRWEAQLVHVEGEKISHLFIGGEPEHLVVSQ